MTVMFSKHVPTIGAIPTTYQGVRFRSRTEARWAVFFDQLEIPWDYEPEGYQLPSGWYMPDFWLPEHRIFFEVKPRATPEGFGKCCELIMQTGRPVCMSLGQPAIPRYGQSLVECDCQIGHMVPTTEDDDLPVHWNLAVWLEACDEYWPLSSRFWPSPIHLGNEVLVDVDAFQRVTSVYPEGGCSADRVFQAVETTRGFRFWDPKESSK